MGSGSPINSGSHHGGQATPSSFFTRSPARSIAVRSSDALCAKLLGTSAGQVVSKASCTAQKSLRTLLAYSPHSWPVSASDQLVVTDMVTAAPLRLLLLWPCREVCHDGSGMSNW